MTKWRISAWHGQHEEAGALIVDQDGKHILTTYGGLRAASSPDEWYEYRRTARLAAAAAEMYELLAKLCTPDTPPLQRAQLRRRARDVTDEIDQGRDPLK